ncbi:hypothetical protein SALBM135S_00421 [Streptomyces alboniger]
MAKARLSAIDARIWMTGRDDVTPNFVSGVRFVASSITPSDSTSSTPQTMPTIRYMTSRRRAAAVM